MTLAIGALCDSGAVLLTDAMRVMPRPDGSVTGFLQPDARKILHAPRFAAVHSGGAPLEWPPNAQVDCRTLGDFASKGLVPCAAYPLHIVDSETPTLAAISAVAG